MIVFKKIVLKNDRFYKRAFFEIIVFYKTRRFVNDEPSLKIINDDPSLTIVNEERKRNKKQSFNDCFQKRLTTLIATFKRQTLPENKFKVFCFKKNSNFLKSIYKFPTGTAIVKPQILNTSKKINEMSS